MTTRREFLTMAAGLGIAVSVGIEAGAKDLPSMKKATAVTKVFGDGVRFIAVAIEFTKPLTAKALSSAAFSVKGRTIVSVFPASSADPAHKAESGRFVIVSLSPQDADAPLATKTELKSTVPETPRSGGPGKAGDIPANDTYYRAPHAVVAATGDGEIGPIADGRIVTSGVKNLVVDEFQQLEFIDPKTGRTLKYNLFVPQGYDAQKTYPLVLFMHDAGATSDATRTTLFQGLGAIAWASGEDQAARPSFVLAPQYGEIIADDDSETSSMLDTTIDLVRSLCHQYSIDPARLYATGQSGGCMMSIAMNIKYTEFFAASFLVAGQWDPALVKPLTKKRLWILVSQDDDKAWPGENAITDIIEKQGAKVSRAVWDGTWTADQFSRAFDSIDAEGSTINYVAFRKGTVIPVGEATEGASGHRSTWRIGYSIPSIREWLLR
ncbi:peptidase [Rhizobium sp. 18055]|uniref:peptidase n=1 Tax=Rhizobium sp. 18055 TaxID=2681403 RepID=UPI0013570511|nr:peptidase [Rhizobium sp. 18055]